MRIGQCLWGIRCSRCGTFRSRSYRYYFGLDNGAARINHCPNFFADTVVHYYIIIAAYGTTARIAKKSIKELRAKGIKAGLLRPITLWPFPSETFAKAAERAKCILTVEMSCGQMVEDVRLAVNGRIPVEFFGRVGGMIPSWREIMDNAEKTLKGGKE